MNTTTANNPVAKTPITSEKIRETWALIRVICHFIPIVCSLVWLIYYTLDPSRVVADYILFPLAMIGWIAAVIACPLRFLKTTFGLVVTGWKIGWTLCPFVPMCFFTALLGAGLGFVGGLAVGVYAPAVVTIYSFFKD